MSSSAEVAADFKDALQDLKVNSRPEISNLTIIAKENTEHAQAISRELENHIQTARPEWKLPALYVLDSIVKNVGTPYTVYLGRNLYRTFMDAYLLMDSGTRRAMEGLLRTWKQPVPESMDARPVFPPEVTGDLDNSLNRLRSVTAQTNSLPPRPPLPPQGLPARPIANANATPWRNTPTPPQNFNRYPATNDPRVRQPFPPGGQYGGYPNTGTPPVQFQPNQPYQPPPVTSIDLNTLKADLGKLIETTKNTWAANPADISLQQKLKALLDLETVLRTQTLPPQQLEAVRMQIQNLSPSPAPTPLFNPPMPVPPAIRSPQQQAAPTFPPANPPVNLAQILAGLPQPASTPTAPPPAPTPSLADLLRRVTTPTQSSSTPAAASFFPPPYSTAAAPVPAPGPIPAAPALPANLAALLASMNTSSTPPVGQTPHSIPASLPIAQPQTTTGTPALGMDWVLNALKGLPGGGTPLSSTPIASEPMTRQTSGQSHPAFSTDVELATASMKKPRLHLIASLYEAKPNMCQTCGRRFEATPEGKLKKARHMDWHFKVKDPDAQKRGIHRSWYITEKEWIEYREVDETNPDQGANGAGGPVKAPKKEAKDRYVLVPSDTALANAPCPICQDEFKTSFNKDANDFVWMDAIKANGRIYHATCWEEVNKGSGLGARESTPDSVLGKRKAEMGTPGSGKKVRAF
ncbi:hypothetical protein BDV96DRAFT_487821 [Lophiotrema nucula]|uniref:CID domain-containing protein n=1 Tax=Lophiotrema nucula TaxID=690887 RepID=A0A6A5ZJ75_9PLEO|nr:hypothetical protein BDV96DRAFT_487821 [Lophiotrema nucula]